MIENLKNQVKECKEKIKSLNEISKQKDHLINDLRSQINQN